MEYYRWDITIYVGMRDIDYMLVKLASGIYLKGIYETHIRVYMFEHIYSYQKNTLFRRNFVVSWIANFRELVPKYFCDMDVYKSVYTCRVTHPHISG